VRTALTLAINRAHSRVEEHDIEEAETKYSQFALDTIETEASAAFPSLGNLLYEFAGANEIVEKGDIENLISKAGLRVTEADRIIEYLTTFNFLGVEIREGEFDFAADEQDMRKNTVLARNIQESRQRPPRTE
jgi:hypothetical protein